VTTFGDQGFLSVEVRAAAAEKAPTYADLFELRVRAKSSVA